MASVHRRPQSRFWHAAWRTADGVLCLRSTKQTDRNKALACALEFERADKLAGTGSLTEEQARKILSDILERAGGGETLRCPSVAEHLNEWLAGKEAMATAGTLARYQKSIREFIAHLGLVAQKPLSALTPRHVQRFVADRMKQGLSPSTVRIDAKAVGIALNRARRLGLISTNPAEAVELPTGGGVERGTYTAAEIGMLVRAATGEWRTLIEIGYYTGQRLGDCVDMRWADVDLAAGTWTLTQRKTGRKMIVPLHPALLSKLEALAGVDTPQEHVMPGMAGKGPGGRHGLSESFKAIMQKAGVDPQRIEASRGVRTLSRRTFHAIRHSFTSALANASVPEDLRMKLTGHASVDMHRGYTHHEVETLRAALTKLPSIEK